MIISVRRERRIISIYVWKQVGLMRENGLSIKKIAMVLGIFNNPVKKYLR
jgi:hypothetical protein